MNTKETMHRFRKYLDTNYYNILYREISGVTNYCFNPFQTENYINLAIQGLSDKERKLIKILVLGETFTEFEFGDTTLLMLLLELNIISKKNNMYQFNYTIIAYLDIYVIVSIPYFYAKGSCESNDVYIGQDSYRLSAIIPKVKSKNCLELCSGSGIQSIIASYSAFAVDSVDLNINAVNIGKLNAELNDRENITFYQGNLYEPIKNKQYELIICNPPFIPVRTEMSFYPICGAAGENGLQIIDSILKDLKSHLIAGGKLIMIGEALMLGDNIPLLDSIKKYIPIGFAGKLFIHSINTIESHIERFVQFNKQAFKNKISKEIEGDIRNMFNNMNATNYFSFTLELINTTEDYTTHIEKIYFYPKINDNSIFINRISDLGCNFVENITSYSIIKNNEIIATIDKEMYDILKNNNIVNINEIIKSEATTKSSPYLKQALLDACIKLEKTKILERRN